MKKIISPLLLPVLLVASTLSVLPVFKAGQSEITPILSEESEESELHVTPSLPPEICNQKPIGGTATSFVTMSALDEADDPEGDKPIYVLMVADEEARIPHQLPNGHFVSWQDYFTIQLERADNPLVSNFGIDIRIVGWEEWDSSDSTTTMVDLWYELASEENHWLGQWYSGCFWSNWIDCVVAVTGQCSDDPVAGVAPGNLLIDQGKIFILIRWLVWWADDNLIKHEFSHLYRADDHHPADPTCCSMAYHTHYQTFILEDGLWAVFCDVPCALTSDHWCSACVHTISTNQYSYLEWPVTVTCSAWVDFNWVVRYAPGFTNPPANTYLTRQKTFTIRALSIAGLKFCTFSLTSHRGEDYECTFVDTNPLTVTLDREWKITAIYVLIDTPKGGSGAGGS